MLSEKKHAGSDKRCKPGRGATEHSSLQMQLSREPNTAFDWAKQEPKGPRDYDRTGYPCLSALTCCCVRAMSSEGGGGRWLAVGDGRGALPTGCSEMLPYMLVPVVALRV